jgi:hypothetical protein
MVVCRQHTQPNTTPPLNHTTNPTTTTPYSNLASVVMTSTSNLPPTYRHVLMRDSSAHAHAADQSNPRSRLAGHPLAPFVTVPQPPPAKHDLGIAPEPSHGRGLKAPLIFAAPRSSTDLGRAADLSARTVDSYLLTWPILQSPPPC